MHKLQNFILQFIFIQNIIFCMKSYESQINIYLYRLMKKWVEKFILFQQFVFGNIITCYYYYICLHCIVVFSFSKKEII